MKLDIHTARTHAKRAPLVNGTIARWMERGRDPRGFQAYASRRLVRAALRAVAEREDKWFYSFEYGWAASLLLDGAE